MGGANPIDTRRSSDLHQGGQAQYSTYDNGRRKDSRVMTITILLRKQNDGRLVVNCGKVNMHPCSCDQNKAYTHACIYKLTKGALARYDVVTILCWQLTCAAETLRRDNAAIKLNQRAKLVQGQPSSTRGEGGEVGRKEPSIHNSS